MSGIKGSLKENKQYSKKTGWFEFKPLIFNPDKDQLEELLGATLEKEPEYLGEDDEGNSKLTVSVWGENVMPDENGNNEKFAVRFTLINKRNESERTGKSQYINSVGETGWADDESNLQNWFTHFLNKNKEEIGEKSFQPAIVGEESFYSFLRSVLKMDFFNPETEILLDRKKLFKNDFRDLNDLIKNGDERMGTAVVVATIRTVSKDGEEDKEYQSIYNKAFLPGSYMKTLRLNPTKKAKIVEKFLTTINDREHGIKDYFIAGELREYDGTKNPAASAETVIHQDDNSY